MEQKGSLSLVLFNVVFRRPLELISECYMSSDCQEKGQLTNFPTATSSKIEPCVKIDQSGLTAFHEGAKNHLVGRHFRLIGNLQHSCLQLL